MPRTIYKPSDRSPYTLTNISTGKSFSKDREDGVIPNNTDIPSYKTRRNASENNWYIEIKVQQSGKTPGKAYWKPIKDRMSVSNLVNITNDANDLSSISPQADRFPETSGPKYIERRSQRDFSIKRTTSLKLLEKQHSETIPMDLEDDETIINLVLNARKLKPSFLKMESESWKLLVRSALRGKNVLMLGDKGEGKTIAAYALKNALGRPFFSFNFGNMQDAQTALIGKTHLDTNTGTWFNKSDFIKAIETPNAIILCDELSRMTDDASNITFSIFDENQRYIRLNESEKSEVINVAKGVCFVATANIGFQYTGTKKLDAAMFDRWVKIEVDQLTKSDRQEILRNLFPDLTDYIVETISQIADAIKVSYESEDPKVTTTFSTRMCITLAELIYDGFLFLSAVEKTVYPEYSIEGGSESERTFVKQAVQGLYDSGQAEFPFKSQKVKKIQVDDNGVEIEI